MRPTRSAAALLVGGAAGRPPSAGSDRGSSFKGGLVPERRLSRAGTGINLLSSLEKFEFGHARGEHGLQWDETVVVRVSGQARKLGIRPGWKIYSVDGHVVTTGEDVWMRLQEAKWQWRSAQVQFVTDMQAIRAEQAHMKVSRIQRETERLARLPFETTTDSTHLEQVKEEFAFQGYIDGAEYRGITMAQLKRIAKWTADHCHRWRDVMPATISRTSRQKLDMTFMNMHHLNHWLVKPATREKDCAFVELLTKEKQPPVWFVIHWWGEPVHELLKCIDHHVLLRALTYDSPFWIGAFAKRQWSMPDCTTEDVTEMCFYKALQLAKFNTLLMVDSKAEYEGPGTAFQRSWCDLELILCLEGPAVDYELDIVSCVNSKPMIVTKGLTEEEVTTEKRNSGAGYKAKFEREKAFPLEIVEVAFQLKIQASQTTEVQDRSKILSWIANKMDAAAVAASKDHEAHMKANKRLQSLLALSFFRRVLSAAGDSDMQRLQARLVDALRDDIWREELDLSLSYCAAGEEKLALLAKGFPSSLKKLRLDVHAAGISDKGLGLLSSGLPSNLESLGLDVSVNEEITNAGVINFCSQAPPKLKTQYINMKQTSCTKEFVDSADSLEGLRTCIHDESQKGASCVTVNLIPQPGKGKGMILNVERCRLKDGF